MAKQRRGKILGQTGDVNIHDYDAGIVFRNQGEIQWEFWQWQDEDTSAKAVADVYRVTVPDDVFGYYDWADVARIASSIGSSAAELRELGKSSKVMDRVYALDSIVGHDGAINLDSYPIQLTRSELKRRWR